MKKVIITISRQFASGGREIAKTLSRNMGIELYDKEILDLAAKQSGIDIELIKEHDETPTNSFLYSLSLGTYSHTNILPGFHDLPLIDKVFNVQSDIIREAAEKGSCIIVGRCAESILSDHPEVVSVFIHSDLETRARRVCDFQNIDYDAAYSQISKHDKRRANYHNRYCNTTWGDACAYDLCIDSRIGIENCAKLIQNYIENL